MELNSQKLGEEHTIIGDVQKTIEFSINITSQPIIIDSLINLYEDPIGSIVREITSNCVDAHKEKDLKLVNRRALEEDDLPEWFSPKNVVQIEYCTDFQSLHIKNAIIFRDFGVGLSEKRVNETFTVFGSSTKRIDNEEIGGFGLGAKSPFAYTDTFFIRTRRNGIESSYMLSRGQIVPTMDKVSTSPTNEKNGTEVIIPIKDRYEAVKFLDAINRQLRYFPELYYINLDQIGRITTKNIIYDNEDFLLDGNNNTASILIANVEYPLNSYLLDTKIPKCGVKYKFNVGELDLVPSREAIRYTESTKKQIQSKIQKVNNFAKNEVSKLIETEKDFITKYSMTIIACDTDHVYEGDSITSQAFKTLCRLSSITLDIPFTYGNLTVSKENLKYSFLFKGFSLTQIKPTKSTLKRYPYDAKFYSIKDIGYTYLKDSNEHSKKKDNYLTKITHPGRTIYTLEPKDDSTMSSELLKYCSGKEDLAKPLIEQQKIIVKNLTEYFTKAKRIYADVQEYKEERTNLAALRAANSKVFYRNFERTTFYSEEFAWTNTDDTLTNLDTNNTIYGFEVDRDKLEGIKFLLPGKKVIRIAKTIKDLFEEASHVDDFIVNHKQDIINVVDKNHINTTLQKYELLSNFGDVDIEIFTAFLNLRSLQVPGTAAIQSRTLFTGLKNLGFTDTELISTKVLETSNKLESLVNSYDLILSFCTNPYSRSSDFMKDSSFKKILSEYITLIKVKNQLNQKETPKYVSI